VRGYLRERFQGLERSEVLPTREKLMAIHKFAVGVFRTCPVRVGGTLCSVMACLHRARVRPRWVVVLVVMLRGALRGSSCFLLTCKSSPSRCPPPAAA
jgi:hypothetical protein